jgi:hypothetical protein
MQTDSWLRYKPSVPRRWLFLFAGTLWMIAGGILCWRGAAWVLSPPYPLGAALAAGGLLLALPAYYFGFSRLVGKNIRRISELRDRPCLFAFSPWRGYGMIILMMSLGLLLRQSSIPPAYLIVPYVCMGTLLLVSSLQFFRRFLVTSPG